MAEWPLNFELSTLNFGLLPCRIEIKIRQASAADSATIARFNAALAWETEKRRLDLKRVLAGVQTLFEKPGKGIYFVAEVEDNGGRVIAGQLLITYEWSDWRNGDFWWIQSVYVDERFRSRGIFRALFNHVHNLARHSKDVCGVRLYMEAHNDNARRAYEGLSMKRTDYQVFEMDFVL